MDIQVRTLTGARTCANCGLGQAGRGHARMVPRSRSRGDGLEDAVSKRFLGSQRVW